MDVHRAALDGLGALRGPAALNGAILEKCWEEAQSFAAFEELLHGTRQELDMETWRQAACFLFRKAHKRDVASVMALPGAWTFDLQSAKPNANDGSEFSPPRPTFTKDTIEGRMLRAISPGSTPTEMCTPLNLSMASSPTPTKRTLDRRPLTPPSVALLSCPSPVRNRTAPLRSLSSVSRLDVLERRGKLLTGRGGHGWQEPQNSGSDSPLPSAQQGPVDQSQMSVCISESSDQPESRQNLSGVAGELKGQMQLPKSFKELNGWQQPAKLQPLPESASPLRNPSPCMGPRTSSSPLVHPSKEHAMRSPSPHLPTTPVLVSRLCHIAVKEEQSPAYVGRGSHPLPRYESRARGCVHVEGAQTSSFAASPSLHDLGSRPVVFTSGPYGSPPPSSPQSTTRQSKAAGGGGGTTVAGAASATSVASTAAVAATTTASAAPSGGGGCTSNGDSRKGRPRTSSTPTVMRAASPRYTMSSQMHISFWPSQSLSSGSAPAPPPSSLAAQTGAAAATSAQAPSSMGRLQRGAPATTSQRLFTPVKPRQDTIVCISPRF